MLRIMCTIGRTYAQCELCVAGDRGALRIRYPQPVPRIVSK